MRPISSVLISAVLMIGCSSTTEDTQIPTTDVPSTTSTAPEPTASTTETATPPSTPPAPKKALADLIKENFAANDAGWLSHDPNKIGATYAANAVFMKPGMQGAEDRSVSANMVPELKSLFSGFPDLKMKTVRVVQAGSIAIAEWAVAGKNTGEAWGQKPTNKDVGYSGVSVLIFDEQGKITREHLYSDDPTLMSQLGMPGMRGRPVQPLPTGATEWITQTGSEEEKKNADAVKAFYAAYDSKDSKAITASMTDDVVFVDMGRPDGDTKTNTKVTKDWETFSKAFPDVKFSPKSITAAGNLVVVEGSFSGTMKGNLGPIKATNKNGTVHFVDILELKGGKVSKLVSYNNGAEFAGAFLPPPPAPKGPPAAKPAPAPGGDKAAKPPVPKTK